MGKNAQDVLTRLIQAYRKEEGLYCRMLNAAKEQERLLREGSQDQQRLKGLIEAQQQLAEQIGGVEAQAAQLKEAWEGMSESASGPHISELRGMLDNLLDRIGDLIQQIRKLEEGSKEIVIPQELFSRPEMTAQAAEGRSSEQRKGGEA